MAVVVPEQDFAVAKLFVLDSILSMRMHVLSVEVACVQPSFL